MENAMEKIKYYDLNPSQEVVKLQCKYTLFKRVINILTSMATEEKLDFEVMKQALNKVIERNDCLRIRFVKKNKKLMQYFAPHKDLDFVPVLSFATREEQEAFIEKTGKDAIKYMDGIVIEPYFINTYDGKSMVFLKVCHLILDMYGISIVFKDLFEVYDALKNNKALPPLPASFEEVVKKDLVLKANEESYEKQKEFFKDYLSKKEEPFYVGLGGENNAIWAKRKRKGLRAQKMFFIKNDTKGYALDMGKELTSQIIDYCQESKVSPASFLLYTMSVCASKINGNVKNMLPLELCNCRGSINERKCAGTKVQSLGCYVECNHEKTFNDNLAEYIANRNIVFRRISFSDQDFELLLHKTYKSSVFSTYYSITYSFIPYVLDEKLDFQIYSNGKCALPAYIGHLYNAQTGEMVMIYDVQTKIVSEADVNDFHKKYLKTIQQVLQNPEIIIKDIKL